MKYKSVRDALLRNAAEQPQVSAVVSSQHDALSYRALADQIERFGACLRGAGFGETAKIGIVLASPPRAAPAIVAVSCHSVAVPLDPSLTETEVEQRFRLLELDAIILPAGEDSTFRAVAGRLAVPIFEAMPNSASELGLTLAAPEQTGPRNGSAVPHGTAFILQSSGTTAEPKLIPYGHENMLAAADRVTAWYGLRSNDRCLSVSPVYYCHGLTLTVFVPLLSGGSAAFPQNPALIDLDEWFVGLEPSWFSGSPTLHQAFLDKIEQAGSFDHRLRFAVSGGAPLDPELQTTLQTALGVPVLEHYGATEAAQISSNRPEPNAARSGTCGIPPAGTVKVVDEDGKEVGRNENGQILICGPTVIGGYLNAPELNTVAFARGWYHSGDIGNLDADGFLSVRGRLKEIINRGGEKISPMEIEAALLRHPEIAEAAAFPVPHPRLGEDIGAVVVLRSQAGDPPGDLRRFLSTQLAWFKIPRNVKVVEELPKGRTGKVQRRKLSEAANA